MYEIIAALYGNTDVGQTYCFAKFHQRLVNGWSG